MIQNYFLQTTVFLLPKNQKIINTVVMTSDKLIIPIVLCTWHANTYSIMKNRANAKIIILAINSIT